MTADTRAGTPGNSVHLLYDVEASPTACACPALANCDRYHSCPRGHAFSRTKKSGSLLADMKISGCRASCSYSVVVPAFIAPMSRKLGKRPPSSARTLSAWLTTAFLAP